MFTQTLLKCLTLVYVVQLFQMGQIEPLGEQLQVAECLEWR